MKIERSTLQHLRFPFSILLMPVFLLALSHLLTQFPFEELKWFTLGAAFLILHLLVYPSSNGYNSWCDQDEGPIGGVLQPLPASHQLRVVSLVMDGLALTLGGLLISIPWALALLIYIVASRAYSHRKIRLKARPWFGWLTVVFFQGPWIIYLVQLAAGVEHPSNASLWIAAALLFGGGYPITQIYQHQEDERRGDLTLSRLLGVRGTLGFSGLASGTGLVFLVLPWIQAHNFHHIGIFLFCFALGAMPLVALSRRLFNDPDFAHSGVPAARAVSRVNWALSTSLTVAFFLQSLLSTLN
jgi:1,4-dihydroxy-2-naphthoate octaprenyltransferase